MKNTGAMHPATVYMHHDKKQYLSAGRIWQGIPGIECTKEGKLYATWYSGGIGEQPGNVILLERSCDGGRSWTEGFAVVVHDDPTVRCFDPAIWLDPLGRLWLFWTQSRGMYDARDGVWAAVCNNPDADDPCFDAPCRIANGLMLNKPTVTDQGEWLLPCALWSHEFFEANEQHPELAAETLANVYVSADNGETFSWRGGVEIPDRGFDEHMIVQKQDGRLWMLVRTKYGIGQAFSSDGGRTWQNAGPSGHTGPNSRFFIRRLKSGNLLLVNHVSPTYLTNPKDWNDRNNLMAMISEDDGLTWHGGLMLDARDGVSYPDGIQTEDGTIHIIYDYDRYGQHDILMATFTEEDVLAGRDVSGKVRYQQLVNRASGHLTTAEELWARFSAETGIQADYDAWAFGDNPRHLSFLVIRGIKTATASAHALYALDDEPLPQIGEYNVILNEDDLAVCITRTTNVSVIPFKEITEEQAAKEGEGDKSLAYWRNVHEAFFTKELQEAGMTFTEDMLVVFEEFEVVYHA